MCSQESIQQMVYEWMLNFFESRTCLPINYRYTYYPNNLHAYKSHSFTHCMHIFNIFPSNLSPKSFSLVYFAHCFNVVNIIVDPIWMPWNISNKYIMLLNLSTVVFLLSVRPKYSKML